MSSFGKGNTMDHTQSARSVNGKDGDFVLLQLAHAAGGGVVPLEGRFDAETWAFFLQKDAATFRTWVNKNKIPCKRPGGDTGTMFVDAKDFWDHLPYCNCEEQLGAK
jgi:hypothetical protein